MNKRETGSRYEDAAAAFLQSKGLRLLEKNFRCRKGEIDLILMDGACLDGRKQKKIRHTAAYYMYIRRISQDTPCRFDAVGIMGESIQWIQDAF